MKKFLIAWSAAIVLLGTFLFTHLDRFSSLGRSGMIRKQTSKLKDLKKSYEERCTTARTRKVKNRLASRKKKAFYPDEGLEIKIRESAYLACEQLRSDIKSRELALQQFSEAHPADDEGARTETATIIMILLIFFWFVPVVAANLTVIAWKNKKTQKGV